MIVRPPLDLGWDVLRNQWNGNPRPQLEPQMTRLEKCKVDWVRPIGNISWLNVRGRCRGFLFHRWLQLSYKLTAHKLKSFGSNFPGSCLCLGGFHRLEIRSRSSPRAYALSALPVIRISSGDRGTWVNWFWRAPNRMVGSSFCCGVARQRLS